MSGDEEGAATRVRGLEAVPAEPARPALLSEAAEGGTEGEAARSERRVGNPRLPGVCSGRTVVRSSRRRGVVHLRPAARPTVWRRRVAVATGGSEVALIICR